MVNFYADLMGYSPRYFSTVFRQFSGGLSPLEWIQQYVATQAKPWGQVLGFGPYICPHDYLLYLFFPPGILFLLGCRRESRTLDGDTRFTR